jgi:FxsC-like protein
VSRMNRGGSGSGLQSSYFYLSYAQSPPLPRTVQDDPDQWVRKFYDDLTDAVQSHASPGSGLRPGVFDKALPLGSDWKASLTEALSRAEVFIPLYSPRYFAQSWPGREWACFEQRLIDARVEEPLHRFVPVLWTPLPRDIDAPGLSEAMAGAEPVYAENGLRTLLRLRPYRQAYERVVEQLAVRIVDLAENSPVGPSPVPDIASVTSKFKPEAYGAVFAITMAAPKRSDLPSDRNLAGYGKSDLDWKPYPSEQQLPLADHAVRIAERMDFAVLVTSIEKEGDQLTSRPGVLLIDPWFVAKKRGLALLRSFVATMPVWVLPLLVLGANQDSRSAKLVEQVRGILQRGVGKRAVSSRGNALKRAIRGVDSLADFAALMPILVAEAERQYLRHGPILRSAAGVGRLRLASDPPAEPVADPPPDLAKEARDA